MEKECLDAFRFEKKEEALKLLEELSNPQTFIDIYFGGWTLMHHAAWNGWEDVCKLLVEKYNCDPTAVDDYGIEVHCTLLVYLVVKHQSSTSSLYHPY